MTVGFLYGAGAETLIFVTGTSGKKKTKLFVSRKKNQSQRWIPRKPRKMCLGIRCWDPNLSGGYQNCGLGIHRWEMFSKSFWEKLGIFLESLGGSQRQLCIKTRLLYHKLLGSGSQGFFRGFSCRVCGRKFLFLCCSSPLNHGLFHQAPTWVCLLHLDVHSRMGTWCEVQETCSIKQIHVRKDSNKDKTPQFSVNSTN